MSELTQEEIRFVEKNRALIKFITEAFFVRLDKLEVQEGRIIAWHVSEASSKNQNGGGK